MDIDTSSTDGIYYFIKELSPLQACTISKIHPWLDAYISIPPYSRETSFSSMPLSQCFPEDYSRLIQCTDNQVIAQWYQNLFQFVQYLIILYTLTLTIATLEYKLSELFSISFQKT